MSSRSMRPSRRRETRAALRRRSSRERSTPSRSLPPRPSGASWSRWAGQSRPPVSSPRRSSAPSRRRRPRSAGSRAPSNGPGITRADPAEALVTRDAGVTSIADLAAGAKVGTSSVRRVAQIRYLRADLDIVPLRGNVPTRVQKVKEGRDGLDAALLAGAGLERLALAGQLAARLDPLDVMPAPGQGALGLEVRADDRNARGALAPLEDAKSARHGTAERSLLAALEGGCQATVAAYCGSGERGAGSRLYGRVTAPDGSVQITASAEIDEREPAAAGARVADLLRAQGASRLLGR